MFQEQIEPLYTDITVGNELELSLYDYMESSGRNVPLGFLTYLHVRKHLDKLARSTKTTVTSETTLDFIFEYEQREYRLVITGLDAINRTMATVSGFQNYMAAKVLLKRFAENHAADRGAITFMHKERIAVVNLTDYSGRVRKAVETDLTTHEALTLSRTLDQSASNKIIFRYKQRRSLVISDRDGVRTTIDLTLTKQNRTVSRIESSPESYELELELYRHKSGSNRTAILADFVTVAKQLYRVIGNTDTLLTIGDRNTVLEAYRKLSGNTRSSLEVRNAISMELYHAVDKVANRYAVFDKAEGERAMGIIHTGVLYLISTNLHIIDSGINISAEWDGTLIDGEYMPDSRMYLPFDILFDRGTDIRSNPDLRKRIDSLDVVVGEMLPANGVTVKTPLTYTGDMQLDKLVKHYTTYATDYYRTMHTNLANRKRGRMLVLRKLALFPYGVSDAEVFSYMAIIRTLYRSGKLPYILDGIILTPLQQVYAVRRADAAAPELKWKEQTNNSIDFYLRYVRLDSGPTAHRSGGSDRGVPGEIMTLYNNCRDDALKGKPFRIAYLYVGTREGNREVPVLFKRDQRLHIAHLYLDDSEGESGVIRDLEGKPVRDNTVVECYYNNDPSIDEHQRWVVMRTRWDKTESVMRYGTRYGNNVTTAERVWSSIQSPFTYDDIMQLSQPQSYAKHMITLRQRITPDMTRQMQLENAYYQRQKKIMKNQNDFHNWVWSIVIYMYCNPIYNEPKRMNILDVGCGRGGDIMKYYFARSSMVVGIDVDAAGLFSIGDSATARYQQQRRAHENFPPMWFIHADATIPLTVAAQQAALVNTSRDNLDKIQRFFEGSERQRKQVFDAINCKFVLHYFLKDQTAWTNFQDNINRTLRPGGFMFVVCFDAELVMKALGKDGRHSIDYVDAGGNRVKLHEIVQKFTLQPDEAKRINRDGFGVGYAIDMYNSSFMSEGRNYYTEYLVDRRFLERELRTNCNMHLLDTGTLSMLYSTNREFFDKVAPWETSDKTRDFLLGVRKFYNQDEEINRLSFEITRLNRYYIFQKGGTPAEFADVLAGKATEQQRKVPHKATKTVPKEEDGGRRQKHAAPPQRGGQDGDGTLDEDDDSSDSSSDSSDDDDVVDTAVSDDSQPDTDSDAEQRMTQRASRGLRPRLGRRRGQAQTVSPQTEQLEKNLESDAELVDRHDADTDSISDTSIDPDELVDGDEEDPDYD